MCGEYNSNAEHSYFSSSSLCSSSLASYTSTTSLLQHIYETEFDPKYTQVNTTREDERRTLRQLSKRLYKGQDGSSAQQSTVTHSLSLQGLWRQQTVAYEQRHRTQIYMNSWVLRPLGSPEIEASSPCSRPLTYPWNRWLRAS